MNDLIKMMAMGLIRSAIMALGGWMLARGYLDGSTAANVEGSLICLANVAWILASKVHIAGKIEAARAEPPPGYVPAPAVRPQATMAPIANPPDVPPGYKAVPLKSGPGYVLTPKDD